MNQIKISTLLVFLFLGLTSCVSKKDIVYFGEDTINQNEVSNTYTTVFKPDDLLQITISSADIEAVQPFNLPAVAYSSTSNSVVGTPKQQDYLVDAQGMISFPILGTLKIGGLTREETITLLKGKLIPTHLKTAMVNIRISNFKVTVLGDVKNPGTFAIPNERITIIEAIGLASDLNISGQRNNILVIREENEKKIQYRVSLLSNKLFTSPVYYLQQNDVVYVEQNNAKSQSAAANSNTGLFVSITSLAITLISLLTR